MFERQEQRGSPSKWQLQAMEAERLLLLNRQVSYSLWTSLLVSSVLLMVLWNNTSNIILLIWFGLLAAVTGARAIFLWRYLRQYQREDFDLVLWRAGFIFMTALTGALWGFGPIFFFPEHSFTHQVFITLVLAGLVMGALPYLSAEKAAYLSFMLPVQLPYTVYLLVLGEVMHVAMAALMLLFTGMMLFASLRINANINETLSLRFVNEELIDQLRFSNTQLEIRVAQQHKAEQRLRENEARLQTLANAAFEGLILHEKGRIVEANEAAGRMTGYRTQELIGMSVLELVAPESHPVILKRIKEPVETPFAAVAMRRDGSTYPVEMRGGDIVFHGRKLRMVAVRDVTEQRQTELRLMDAKLAAEAADRTKTEFLAAVSHELRTPLNAILGLIQLLRDTPLTQEQEEYLRMSGRAGDMLLKLINDLLDLARIEAGRYDLYVRPMDLRSVVSEVASILQYKAVESENTLSLEIDDALPARVEGDSARLQQILTNLLGNALKFTQHGTVKLSVRLVKWQGDEVRIRFSVKDNGIGIPEDKLDYIFGRFNQIDSSLAREHGGTGLGLAISRQLVEILNGEMGVKSKPGEGAEFWFELPFAVEAGVTQQEAITTDNNDIWSHDMKQLPTADKPIPVLLVEDEPTNQIIARKMLERFNCKLDVADNGLEVVERYKSSKSPEYEIIFMDVQMPKLDGISTTRKLRELGVQTPIVAMTANAMEGDRERCLAAGMNDYLSKPIQISLLQQAIAKWRGKEQPAAGAAG